MTKKFSFFGTLVMVLALVFGLVLSGCASFSTESAGTMTIGGIPEEYNGKIIDVFLHTIPDPTKLLSAAKYVGRSTAKSPPGDEGTVVTDGEAKLPLYVTKAFTGKEALQISIRFSDSLQRDGTDRGQDAVFNKVTFSNGSVALNWSDAAVPGLLTITNISKDSLPEGFSGGEASAYIGRPTTVSAEGADDIESAKSGEIIVNMGRVGLTDTISSKIVKTEGADYVSYTFDGTADVEVSIATAGSFLFKDVEFSNGKATLDWTTGTKSITSEVQTRRNSDGNLVIEKYTGKSEEVLIPAEIRGIPVVEIGEAVFSGNTTVKSITIQEGITFIGKDAFDGCTGLTAITIPASVTRIGEDVNDAEDAFDGATGLTSITVAEANEVYSSDDGVVFNKDKTTLILYPEGRIGSYTIPSSVIEIAYCAFDSCAKLTDVTIPDSVTSIGELAFFGCTGLTSITIPASIKTITGGIKDGGAYGAFVGCTGLTSLTISEGVTSIGATAFYGCTGLTSITIPDSVTYIGGNAFAACSKLTSVTVSPVNGRKWDVQVAGNSMGRLWVFKNSPLDDASKTALRNAGYPTEQGGF